MKSFASLVATDGLRSRKYASPATAAARLNEMLRRHLGCYSEEIKRTDEKGRRHLLGVPLLEELAMHPFSWGDPTSTESATQHIATSSVQI